MATTAELLNQILTEVELRHRFKQIDNLITQPTDDELKAAALDALDHINSHPPQTFYSLQDVMEGADTRWKVLLYLGTARNIARLLTTDWTHNGFSQQIGEFNVESKLGDVKDLYSSLTTELDDRLTALKSTATKTIRHVSGARISNPLSTFGGLFSPRRSGRW